VVQKNNYGICEMSKILIIGNGPSALKTNMGSRIDSNEFDIVCRINRGHRQDDGTLNTGFEKQVGTRCEYWIASDLRVNLAMERYNLYEAILIYTPKFKCNPNTALEVNLSYPSIYFIPTSYEDSINKIVNFAPKWPSTGVMAMHFAVDNFDEVFIYGFDTYSYDTVHYFEDKPNKYKIQKNKEHSPNKEKFYIEYMIKNNKIKVLT